MIDNNLFDKLYMGATLLTPTRRLASALSKAFDEMAFNHRMRIEGSKPLLTWESPTILSLKDWCLQFWQIIEIFGDDNRYLLSSHESLLLMESLIQQSSYAAQLLRPHTTAKLVLSAWQILHGWRQVHQLEEFNESVDQEALKFFCEQYKNYLQKNKLLDESQWLGLIGDYLCKVEKKGLQFSPQKHIIYYGFDDITPQFSYLLQRLESIDWKVEAVSPHPDIPQSIYLLPCQDLQAEILQAAHWAKRILDDCQKKKKRPCIGIVLPNLPEHRDNIITLFESVFAPEAVNEPEAKVNPSYNLSTAIPLLQYPVIQSCFLIFKLLKQTLYVSEVIALLNTPYIRNSMVYYEGYQAIQSSLMTCFKETLTWSELIQCIKENDSVNNVCGPLLEVLQVVRQKIPKNQTYLFSEWRKIFQELLRLFDWPGERTLNSIEYQAVNRFYLFLDEFTQLDAVFAPHNYSSALDKMHKYVSNIAFQPENQGAPIQILGILEASGLHFDHLWLMQLHHENWPPKAEPNPLIPIALQKQMLMPHASSLREYEFSKKLTDRLLSSAQSIICSYPKIQDNNIVFASELIGHLPFMPEMMQEKLTPKLDVQRSLDIKLEYYDDFDDFPLENIKRKSVVKGGSQLLTYQSQCPFKAFAKIRMNANNPDEWSMGVNAKLRGTLLHECLYLFWLKVKSQTHLSNMKDVSAEIKSIINKVISKHKSRTVLTEALWQIENIRLQQLMSDCIQTEKIRPPFDVLALEEIKTVSLSGLKISIRIDRVDRLADNQYLLIDYKTGKVNLNDIISSPLKAPQLPLYLNADFSFNPSAVSWFLIQKEKSEYIGVSNEWLGIDGIKPLVDLKESITWDNLLIQWRENLTQLAENFMQGRRLLNPVDGDQTCRICDLRSFCRIEDKKEVEKNYG